MDELGHILREARETKGISLQEAQDKTRINARFLEALENGNYQFLPTPVHAKGFLRNYARYLGLDPEPLLNRYLLNQSQAKSFLTTNGNGTNGSLPYAPPSDNKTVFFESVHLEVNTGSKEPKRDPESVMNVAIIAALLVFIVLVGYKFLPLVTGQEESNGALLASATAFIENLLNGEATTEPELTAVATPLPGDSVIVSTSRNDLGTPEIVTTVVTNNTAPTSLDSTPQPTRGILPATLDEINLRLEITERTWMEVTIDGDIVFSGLAHKGDAPYEWTAVESAKVVTGNAAGVFVTINNIPLGKMGERGQNKEQVWETTK